MTDFGGKTSIFSHPVYLFLREFSLQDFRGGSVLASTISLLIPVTLMSLQAIAQDARRW
ncbi:transposase [Escherichia coli O26:H11 str. 05-3646]|nr:transposase [Escherichia coli O26:H11 str. 05-3646]